MELHTINQNEAGIRLGMADYYNGYKMSIPNTSMKIAGESIEDLHISDKIPHVLRGTYLTVSNADTTRPVEIIGLQGGSATGTNAIKVDMLPIQIADTTRDGLSITRDERDITINGRCEPTGTIKTGTTVTHSNATDWARLNSFTNTNVSSTVENTSFTLTNADSTKQASITELKGNTTQEGTPTPSSPVEVKTVSGDNNVVVSNKNELDRTICEENKILTWATGVTSNNTNSLVTGYMIAKQGQKYVFNYSASMFFYDYNYEYLGCMQTNNVDIAKTTGGVKTFVTVPNISNITYMRLSFRSSNNDNADMTTANIQIERGESTTTYIEHQGNSYRVDLGYKNKFIGASSYSKTINGVTFEIANDILTIDGTSTATGQTNQEQTVNTFVVPYAVKPSTQYTYRVRVISGSVTGTRWAMNLRAGETTTAKNIQFNSGSSLELISGTNQTTFTSSATANYLTSLQFIFSADASFDNLQVQIELCEGSQAQHISSNPIELNKIGNYQDKLYYDSGKWYIEKNIGKVVLNGSESWTVANNGSTGTYRFYISKPSDMQGSSTNFLSNYFSNFTSSYTTTDNSMYVGGANYIISRVKVNNSYITTVSDFQTWLGNNNVTVYYVLANPTYTEITDTYLISQLNALKDIQLYDNLCYVDWVGSEAPTMKLFYNYLKLTGTHNLTVRKADLVDTYPITFDGDYELDEGDTIAFTEGEWQFNGDTITDTDLVTQLNATRHMDLFQNTNYITLNNDVTLTVAIIPNNVDFVLAQDDNGLFSVKQGDVFFIDKQGYNVKLQFKISNSYFTIADTDGVINYTSSTTRVIKRILLTIPTDTSISNDLARFRLYRGTEADNTYPVTLGSLVIGNGDYLHNEAGKWMLNTTEITDTTLLANLRAIERLKLYDGETNYINWHGTDKMTMILQYFYKEGDSE